MNDDDINYNEDREYYYKNQPSWSERNSKSDSYICFVDGKKYDCLLYFEVFTQVFPHSTKKSIHDEYILYVRNEANDELSEEGNKELFERAYQFWIDNHSRNFTEA